MWHMSFKIIISEQSFIEIQLLPLLNIQNLIKKMFNQRYEELPLPPDYEKIELGHRIIGIIQIHFTLVNFSILMQQISSINIIYQSVLITITLVVLLFSISYELYIHRDAHRSKTTTFFVLVTIVLGVITILQIPYYSLMVSAVSLAMLLKMLSKQKIVKTSNFMLSKYDEIIFNFNLLYLSVVLLVSQQWLNVDFRYILIPYLIFTTFMGVSMNLFFISSYRNDRIFKRSVYHSNFRQRLGFVVVNSHNFSLLVFPLHLYFDQAYVTPILWISFILNLIQTFLYWFYFQEIILLSVAPKYSQSQTIFRIYPRMFLQVYSEPKSLRDIGQLDDNCLLCDSKANVVKFPCGHLTTCQRCEAKLRSKYYVFCIVCGTVVTRKRVLRQPLKIRKGYLRKFFIQKKLLKNQYLSQ